MRWSSFDMICAELHLDKVQMQLQQTIQLQKVAESY